MLVGLYMCKCEYGDQRVFCLFVFLFEVRSLTKHGTYSFGYAGWPVSSRDLPPPLSTKVTYSLGYIPRMAYSHPCMCCGSKLVPNSGFTQ